MLGWSVAARELAPADATTSSSATSRQFLILSPLLAETSGLAAREDPPQLFRRSPERQPGPGELVQRGEAALELRHPTLTRSQERPPVAAPDLRQVTGQEGQVRGVLGPNEQHDPRVQGRRDGPLRQGPLGIARRARRRVVSGEDHAGSLTRIAGGLRRLHLRARPLPSTKPSCPSRVPRCHCGIGRLVARWYSDLAPVASRRLLWWLHEASLRLRYEARAPSR